MDSGILVMGFGKVGIYMGERLLASSAAEYVLGVWLLDAGSQRLGVGGRFLGACDECAADRVSSCAAGTL